MSGVFIIIKNLFKDVLINIKKFKDVFTTIKNFFFNVFAVMKKFFKDVFTIIKNLFKEPSNRSPCDDTHTGMGPVGICS